jgi:hypothetical protein
MPLRGTDEVSTLETVALAIRDAGYVFLPGRTVRGLLEGLGSLADWEAFQASWNDLELDTYLGERGRFRKRRYGVYEIAGTTIARQPHQPHHQHVEYNPLFGGIERWFAPVTEAVGAGPSMLTILDLCRTVFGELAAPVARWHVEVHQFRIEARPGERGHPTPEGVHRDGVDFVLVLLVARRNIVSGTTTVHDPDGAELGSFTLTNPFDTALIDDTRVAHGVTPVTPLDPALPACRDVLVVTFRRRTM